MEFGPITSWQIDEETMETVTDIIFLGSKITVDGDCSHDIKKMFALWEKSCEKPGLKLNIQKTKIMVSSPITSWQIDEEKMETVTEFIFLGSKIIADGDCRHKIKRHLLLGRKAMTHLNSMLKSGDITLPNGPYSQSYGFSSSHVWM